jgi:hypothetical protein
MLEKNTHEEQENTLENQITPVVISGKMAKIGFSCVVAFMIGFMMTYNTVIQYKNHHVSKLGMKLMIGGGSLLMLLGLFMMIIGVAIVYKGRCPILQQSKKMHFKNQKQITLFGANGQHCWDNNDMSDTNVKNKGVELEIIEKETSNNAGKRKNGIKGSTNPFDDDYVEPLNQTEDEDQQDKEQKEAMLVYSTNTEATSNNYSTL